MKSIVGVLFFCFVIFLPFNVVANEAPVLVGKVDKILSGDIVTVQSEHGELFIRLAGIDTPDPKQNFGKEAKDILKKLVEDKVVVMRQTGIDPCGRIIAIMWINGKTDLDISSQMVANGAAWVYRNYTQNTELLDLENHARERKKGLWALDKEKRLPPWEWRKRARFEGQTPTDTCNQRPRQDYDYDNHSSGHNNWTPPEFRS